MEQQIWIYSWYWFQAASDSLGEVDHNKPEESEYEDKDGNIFNVFDEE